ncbi:hypothetical protein STENM223S_03537 [Streptomyces tendae]
MDGFAQLHQREQISVQGAGLGQADGPVDGDPGHDLGMHEVPACTADFPDALVGHLPPLGQLLDQPLVQDRGVATAGNLTPVREVEGLDHIAVYIQL